MSPPRLIMVIIILMAAAGELFAATSADVKSGNLLYNNKKFDEAIKIYDTALEKKPDSGILRFNKADALYKKEDYSGAIGSFNKALASGDQGIRRSADYNIGNSYYRVGTEQIKTDFNKTNDF